MPQNAIRRDDPDYVLGPAEISNKLRSLIADPQEVHEENASGGANVEERNMTPSAFVCPNCGGTLFEEPGGNVQHFRCRVGHAYSLRSLLVGENDQLEFALWAAARSLEENAELKRRAADSLEGIGPSSEANRLREDAATQLDQAKLIRERIIEAEKAGPR
jgi:two-component system, chemotaxis family, protein-glutamate methylesterase/glutaminase